MTDKKVGISIEENGKPVAVYDYPAVADNNEPLMKQLMKMAEIIYGGFPPFSGDEIKVLDKGLMELRFKTAAKYLLQAGYGDIKSALQEFIKDIPNIFPEMIDKFMEKYYRFKPTHRL